MISFNNIGHMGRLGNQMFQYAALRGIASHNGYDYSIPEHDIMLTQCFKIPSTIKNKNKTSYPLEGIQFNQKYVDDCPNDVDLYGFFQSEKYFHNVRKELLDDFTFHDDVRRICHSYMSGLFGYDDVIGMHVRRTDYITDSQFYPLSINYYKRALEHFSDDVPVMIVSDDSEWCKEKFSGDRFFVSTSNDMCIDLCLLSLCDYHIIANSSFSWWGSWLAESDKTIAPKQWFSSTGKFKDWSTKDLYRSNWNLI